MHKRNPPTISHEPKHADASAFLDFGVEANVAKASILEFTGVLRSDNGGYVKPGEESRDLVVKTTEDNGTSTDSFRDIQPSGLSQVAQFNFSEPIASQWPTFDIFNSLFDAEITTLLDTLDLSAFDFDSLSWENSNNK